MFVLMLKIEIYEIDPLWKSLLVQCIFPSIFGKIYKFLDQILTSCWNQNGIKVFCIFKAIL